MKYRVVLLVNNTDNKTITRNKEGISLISNVINT
jgi:hypothetical protein